MNDYIKSDLKRYYGDCDRKTFWKAYSSNRLFRFQVALRLCAGQGFPKLVGKVLWKLNRTRHLVEILPETRIGYGLYLSHYGPIVVNPSAIIGNNCNLSQGLTIGANEGPAAILGDNVYIGPNVCLVENVKIGNNVTIGAGSVVTKDIPDNATAAGNYAKVLNFNNPGRYCGSRWEVKKTADIL